jgi:hypothetical protein
VATHALPESTSFIRVVGGFGRATGQYDIDTRHRVPSRRTISPTGDQQGLPASKLIEENVS